MRISDWSSDVCSSDLARRDRGTAGPERDVLPARARAAGRRRSPPAHGRLHAGATRRDRVRRAALGAGGATGRGAGGARGRTVSQPGTAPAQGRADAAVDWARVRGDFPLLRREVNGKPLVYFDSANTGQKPAAVIEAVDGLGRKSTRLNSS